MSESPESGQPRDPPEYGDDDWEDPMEGAVPKSELPEAVVEEVPVWDDPYLDRVSDRLMYNYSLERDHRLRGERWDLHGEMRVLNQKQFFHPALSYADHESEEYLYARRVERPTVDELERLVDLGHELADEWIDAHEEHYRTDFTFVLVADELPEDVREFVDGQRERTLLKYGYYGHYEVNLVVVAPEQEAYVASQEADVWRAFALWTDTDPDAEPGLLDRLKGLFGG